MTKAEARKLVGNQSTHCIRMMYIALNTHAWNNTAEENLRRKACAVLLGRE